MTGPPPVEPTPASDESPAEPPVSGTLFGPAHVLALLGAVAVVASVFFDWVDVSGPGGTRTDTASGVPVQFLVNYTTKSSDPSLVLILAVSSVLCLAAALVGNRPREVRLLAGFGGLIALVTAVLYCFQVHQALHAVARQFHVTVIDFIGIGPMLAAAGGVAALAGALWTLRR
jgi:hypothetical protein